MIDKIIYGGAFIEGHWIIKNMVVTNELVHKIKRHKRTKWLN